MGSGERAEAAAREDAERRLCATGVSDMRHVKKEPAAVPVGIPPDLSESLNVQSVKKETPEATPATEFWKAVDEWRQRDKLIALKESHKTW
jgi:hypothetical protein